MGHSTIGHRPKLNAADLPPMLWRAWQIRKPLPHAP